MSKDIVTEIVEFKIIPGITDGEFIEKVDVLEEKFHSQQSGFIDTELVKGKEDQQWLMIQHWKSIDTAKEAVKLMMQHSITEDFRKAIDPTSVKMSLLVQVKTWNK